MAEVPTATSEGRVFNANYQIKDQHNIQIRGEQPAQGAKKGAEHKSSEDTPKKSGILAGN